MKETILITDDYEMNRLILRDMLGDAYNIIEASDGLEAMKILERYGDEISLVLLDIVMPNMDGFEVLKKMNKKHWIDDIPVIVISAESATNYVEEAYDMGATDFISRPFDEAIVRRRVLNTIMLYAKQKKLIDLVEDQIYEREKVNNLMIEVLSHIVEFRNGESGLHTLHINILTELLLKELVKKTDKYKLTYRDISLISTASSLHDIGKVAIPDEIINKRGKLTKEEFEIMKTHTTVGSMMLQSVMSYNDEPLIRVAYEIVRWHHERYDGKGYPDGLIGEDIPISAQIVSIADVYDALTSERVYKMAYSHETALDMIVKGECGTFNPLVLECLIDVADIIHEEMALKGIGLRSRMKVKKIAQELIKII